MKRPSPRTIAVRGAVALVAAVTLGAPVRAAPAPARAGQSTDCEWEALKVGAGGFVTGMDVDRTGTTYVLRTDTYGAYVGNGSDAWRQVVNAASMPAAFVESFTRGSAQGLGEGVYEIRVAPSDPDRIYMIFAGTIWRSDDRGSRWAHAGIGYVAGGVNPNDDTRHYGEKMAVDPANPDVVYAGATGGLYVTTDAGASWSAVSGVPPPSGAGAITGIVLDPSSGTTGGRTNTIYAVSNGHGVYRSSNAGASWSRLSGGPTTASHAAVAKDGAYYVANGTHSVYRYSGRGWTASASTGQSLIAIATDPFDAARITVARDSGHLAVSTDRGASWRAGGIIWSGGAATRVAKDVPWLAFANESYMSTGTIVFDPRVRNKLWFAEGIGVWYSKNPDNTTRTTWYSHSAGIEQLVARDVTVPPGSPYVFTAGMDRGVFRVPVANGSYPSDYATMGSSKALIGAWALGYSSLNPLHVVAIVNGQGAGDLSGYSLDGGATWTRFPVQPAPGTSGDVAVPSIDDIIAVIGTGYAWRSTDRGRSWTALALPGVSNTAEDRKRLHDGYLIKKHILAVDGVDRKTVYLYFHDHGLFVSTDGGATWELRAQMPSGTYGVGYWHAKLRSVPGQAGHLFFTVGINGGTGQPNPSDTYLWRSLNGGAFWARVPGFQEVYDVALGKAAPGASYPAIYAVGWYNGTFGVWRSIDNTSSWTNIGPFPLGSLDEITVIAASQDVYGDVYVGFQGSGWARGKLRRSP